MVRRFIVFLPDYVAAHSAVRARKRKGGQPKGGQHGRMRHGVLRSMFATAAPAAKARKHGIRRIDLLY
jgi:hypothetical protein